MIAYSSKKTFGRVAAMRRIGMSLLLFAWMLQPAVAAEVKLISVKTPRGATQKFIFIKPEKPLASVILFAGAKGALQLRSATEMGWGKGKGRRSPASSRRTASNVNTGQILDQATDHRFHDEGRHVVPLDPGDRRLRC
jgi:hypothetical protein